LGFRTLSNVRIFLNNNEKLLFRKMRTIEKVRKRNISVCYTPSSEPYSIYLKTEMIDICCPTDVCRAARETRTFTDRIILS
jgi:hypothetical protein